MTASLGSHTVTDLTDRQSRGWDSVNAPFDCGSDAMALRIWVRAGDEAISRAAAGGGTRPMATDCLSCLSCPIWWMAEVNPSTPRLQVSFGDPQWIRPRPGPIR